MIFYSFNPVFQEIVDAYTPMMMPPKAGNPATIRSEIKHRVDGNEIIGPRRGVKFSNF